MVQNPGIKIQDGGGRGTLRRSATILFVLTFAQQFIATVEVVYISQLKPFEASVWGALNAGCSIVNLIVVVAERKRPLLIPFYILAAWSATYLATWFGKHW